ncbi:MAG: endolytic transglycosylase MltG [Polyangiaceae bacterium]|nr:endolytic transglycosylase MltG [Polyangiaceae bacterium]
MKLRSLGYGVVALLAALLIGVGAFVILPGPGDGRSVELTWTPDATAGQAAKMLVDAGLVRSAGLMALYLHVEGAMGKIEPGYHLVQDDMSPRTLVRRLRRLAGGTTVRVVIPEGFNKFDIAARLQDKGVCAAKAFLLATTDPSVVRDLRLPAPDAEGYLFPATYELSRNHQADDVIRRMALEADRRYAELFDTHAEAADKLQAELGWSRHSLVVLASVIEEEAAADEERPLIASVFLNRMRDESFRPQRRLQSDPTARYGCLLRPELTPTCWAADKGVTGSMVRDPLNPYSTYAHAGLPPGPICNPGVRSLLAVLQPANTKYLYFVAKGNGRHAFSESYGEHRDAMQRNGTPTP